MQFLPVSSSDFERTFCSVTFIKTKQTKYRFSFKFHYPKKMFQKETVLSLNQMKIWLNNTLNNNTIRFKKLNSCSESKIRSMTLRQAKTVKQKFIPWLAMYSSSNKKRNTPIYFNANYRREMKLVPIMDYCWIWCFKIFLRLRSPM